MSVASSIMEPLMFKLKEVLDKDKLLSFDSLDHLVRLTFYR